MTASRTSIWPWIIGALTLALAGFHLYTAVAGVYSPLIQRSVHLVGLLIICFLSRGWDKPQEKPGPWELPPLLLLAAMATYLYFALDPEVVLERGIAGPSEWDTLVGGLLIALVLEGARRSVGMPIVLVALCFLLYALLGPYLPEVIAHKGFDLTRLISYLVWSTEGIFGIPMAVSASFVIIFILFGALLNLLGAGDFFMNLSLSLTGRMRSGPAQAAVLGSALMGSISGSSVSNVVTTGTFTIPLMIRSGYNKLFAGAVEAAASTGGQIMPPVMGAGAFVMAEMLGLSYTSIALAASLPAVLYFLSLGLMVYFRARREHLDPGDLGPIPGLLTTLRRGSYLLVPLAVLVYLLVVAQVSPMRAGFFSILALVLTSTLARLLTKKPVPVKEVVIALRQGVITAMPVAMACAAAGIIIGVVSLTGLGVRFTQMVVHMSGGLLWLAALLTMLACLVLGMGLPTTAAYIITSVLGAPALISLGVAPLAAHLFIFYFAIISFITPPVAISAYAASGVSGANAMHTGLVAFRLGLAGFLVPFVFIYSPALILLGGIWDVLFTFLTATLGVAVLAGSLEGWFLVRLTGWLRLLMFLTALALISPSLWLGLLGLGPLLGLLAYWGRERRAEANRRIPVEPSSSPGAPGGEIYRPGASGRI